ncbi:hypothetical protein [Nannocystis pusilla]|uniref:Uncharacterized protein n=1 Tax=Nannocystis pusilla TaxID=889268 RepID=A0ABS7TM88_9BACT|nr:hypothetical protein [Nannocystis pusilla]MBZ5709334.1 hypothetical protein [Nannocystis pusilla]
MSKVETPAVLAAPLSSAPPDVEVDDDEPAELVDVEVDASGVVTDVTPGPVENAGGVSVPQASAAAATASARRRMGTSVHRTPRLVPRLTPIRSMARTEVLLGRARHALRLAPRRHGSRSALGLERGLPCVEGMIDGDLEARFGYGLRLITAGLRAELPIGTESVRPAVLQAIGRRERRPPAPHGCRSIRGA